jgi:lipopolysaccharide/colanic/teichoic acid biosynthesis glycosyltransferase
MNIETKNSPDWVPAIALESPFLRLLLRVRLEFERLLWAGATHGPQVVKRMLDIVLSAIALIVLSPVFLIISICIKLEDRGPVFFVQTRVGKHNRHFKMFKFRSMCTDAERRLQEVLARNRHLDGVTFKIEDDPRITRVGRVLRKLSFDELPQFYNVLLGDMTLVGPRPPVPREVALYSISDHRRLAAIPGITCIWQISGRSEIDFSGQVKLDVEYIENQSLWLDMKILVKTFPAVCSGRGAC